MMTTSTSVLRFLSYFFGDEKGPLGLLFGLLIAGTVLFIYTYPIIQEYRSLPQEVAQNQKSIQDIRQKNQKQTNRIDGIYGKIETISDRQRFQMCKNEMYSDSYRKLELSCGDFK